MPNSSAVNIALAKKARIVTGSEMPPFFAAKLKANGGNPAHSILARFGGSVAVGGVRIATVTAMHSNGLDPDYIGGDLGKAAAALLKRCASTVWPVDGKSSLSPSDEPRSPSKSLILRKLEPLLLRRVETLRRCQSPSPSHDIGARDSAPKYH